MYFKYSLWQAEEIELAMTNKAQNNFFVEYEYPSYCCNEVPTAPASARRLSRREVGHGKRAMRSSCTSFVAPFVP